MAAASPNPARRASLAGTLLMAFLLVILAWQLAYWFWRFAAPPPRAVVTAPANTIDMAAVARLFGAAPPAGSAASASAPSGLKLKGVVAPTPGIAASAIFSTGSGRDVSVYIDNEVQPGVRLVEVRPDHVIVSRGEVRERIDLEAARSVAKGAAPGDARTRGFKINVSKAGANSFAFSRKELDDALRDPNQLNYLGQIGQPPGGGVRMEQAPAGSLAQKLGLQPGDVIKRINGQPVASPGDLARLYTQFGTLSAIQAEVQRGGTTVQLSYAINP
jgi:general secretion pathway protein C